MKSLTTLLTLSFLLTSFGSFGATNLVAENPTCNWKSWFKYPKNNASYEYGKSVYVKVDPQHYQSIDYMDLYVDGKLIRRESKYPYEWCKKGSSSDVYLRKLKEGQHKLKCKIKDKCGKYHEIYCTIYIKGGGNGGGHCDYKAFFKYPQNGKYYNAGSDVYVKVDIQNYQKVKYCELYLNDHFIRKESSAPYEWCKNGDSGDIKLRKMKPGTYKLKCRAYDVCGKYKDYYCTFYVKGGQGGGQKECNYKSYFKYPKNNGSYKYGDDVYVKVETASYKDIAEMQLYVNGKFVRTEKQYPYEWCKKGGNSDQYLRNLKKGTYNLKCKVKTKCGKWYEYFCKFYVR